MKKTLVILLSSLISTYAFSGQNDLDSREKSLPEYSITKNVLDKTLPKTEAVFTFYFTESENPIKTEIKYSYSGINKTVKPGANGKTYLKVKPGKYLFKFYYGANFFEITTDSIEIKPSYREELKLNFICSKVIQVCDKPVIYVYPKESTEVKITMDLKGEFVFTYPKYENGWNFTADPNGTISMDGKKYDYLFWDGKLAIEMNKINWNEGFEVKREDQVKFFEEKLLQMGLSSREIEDYITYWVPRMSVNEKNYIHFIFNEEYNEYASLNVTPKPDKIFRVYMMWTKVEGTNVMLTAQKLQSFSRSGFTVVEWGGSEMNVMPKNVTLDFED